MLFYESAKCLHGRMRKLKGKYYGSIFLHYAPVDKEIWDFNHDVSTACVLHSIIIFFDMWWCTVGYEFLTLFAWISVISNKSVIFNSSLHYNTHHNTQDVIAAVPPHWNRGTTQEHGSRWAGAVRTFIR